MTSDSEPECLQFTVLESNYKDYEIHVRLYYTPRNREERMKYTFKVLTPWPNEEGVYHKVEHVTTYARSDFIRYLKLWLKDTTYNKTFLDHLYI